MNNANKSVILFTAVEVAKITGLDPVAIKALEPVGFGVPGDWHMVGGAVTYTERGVCGLVEAMAAADRISESAKLYAALVKVREERAVPSRQGLEPRPKSADPAKSSEPYYRSHPTLA